MTPLIVKLYILILKNEAKVDVLKYCYVDNSKASVFWSDKKLGNDEMSSSWLALWKKRYGHDFKPYFVSSDSLLALIETYCSRDTINCSNRLRETEQKIRNVAAHEISIITDKRVKQMTGYTCDEIICDIKALFKYSGINMTDDSWNSYEKMNETIVSIIGSEI